MLFLLIITSFLYPNTKKKNYPKIFVHFSFLSFRYRHTKSMKNDNGIKIKILGHFFGARDFEYK